MFGFPQRDTYPPLTLTLQSKHTALLLLMFFRYLAASPLCRGICPKANAFVRISISFGPSF